MKKKLIILYLVFSFIFAGIISIGAYDLNANTINLSRYGIISDGVLYIATDNNVFNGAYDFTAYTKDRGLFYGHLNNYSATGTNAVLQFDSSGRILYQTSTTSARKLYVSTAWGSTLCDAIGFTKVDGIKYYIYQSSNTPATRPSQTEIDKMIKVDSVLIVDMNSSDFVPDDYNYDYVIQKSIDSVANTYIIPVLDLDTYYWESDTPDIPDEPVAPANFEDTIKTYLEFFTTDEKVKYLIIPIIIVLAYALLRFLLSLFKVKGIVKILDIMMIVWIVLFLVTSFGWHIFLPVIAT